MQQHPAQVLWSGKSHAVRRVRLDAERPVQGLGGPPTSVLEISKRISLKHCWPTLSEISDTVNSNYCLVKNAQQTISNFIKYITCASNEFLLL